MKSKTLNVQGGLIANPTQLGNIVKNNRDLCGGNSIYPFITVKARPDFNLYTPGFLTKQNNISNEETP